MLVLATAGHVDHGKSTLLMALTGQKCDRLAQEQKRGMTIDLNFVSWRPSRDHAPVGLVDVPGHQRFAKNMIAGVSALSGFVFCVAADDSWMPQSEEQLKILWSFGVTDGIIVVTKVDLVDREHLSEVKEEVRSRFAIVMPKQHPLVEFSNVEVERCLPEVITELRKLVARLEEQETKVLPRDPASSERHWERGKDAGEQPAHARIWVDRTFTPRGLNPIVTGTLQGGQLSVGDSVYTHPGNTSGVVKSIQCYHEEVECAQSLSRVAVQIAKHSGELARGIVVTQDETMPVSSQWDALVIPFGEYFGSRSVGVDVHVGTSAVAATATCLAHTSDLKNRLFLRLKLERCVPAYLMDRFILRSRGTGSALGAGWIFDQGFLVSRTLIQSLLAVEATHSLAQVRQRHWIWQEWIETLQSMLPGGRLAYALGEMTALGPQPTSCQVKTLLLYQLCKGMLVEESTLRSLFRPHASEMFFYLKKAGFNIRDRTWVLTSFWKSCLKRSEEVLHAAWNDRKKGLSHQELGRVWGISHRERVRALLTAMAEKEVLVLDGKEWLHREDVLGDPALKQEREHIVELLDSSLKPLSQEEVLKLIGRQTRSFWQLVKAGKIRRLGEDHFISEKNYLGYVAQVRSYAERHPQMETKAIKEVLGLARADCVLVLERMDSERITAFQNGFRTLIAGTSV